MKLSVSRPLQQHLSSASRLSTHHVQTGRTGSDVVRACQVRSPPPSTSGRAAPMFTSPRPPTDVVTRDRRQPRVNIWELLGFHRE
jgi:hypothetical protein